MHLTKLFSVFLLLFFAATVNAQSDAMQKVLKELSDSAGMKIDTATPPNDNLTKNIKELRRLRGSFNVNEVAIYKVKEEQEKDKDKPAEFYDKLLAEVTNGDAKRRLENATINLYRKYFTGKDIKQLSAFYKTDAGKKMAAAFPIVIFKSVKAAEEIMKSTSEKIAADMKIK